MVKTTELPGSQKFILIVQGGFDESNPYKKIDPLTQGLDLSSPPLLS